jgi:hypothetical protein
MYQMSRVVRLQVLSPLLTVDAKKSEFVMISAGSIIETIDGLTEPGFHRVRYRGQDLLAFTRDIRERTEEVSLAVA